MFFNVASYFLFFSFSSLFFCLWFTVASVGLLILFPLLFPALFWRFVPYMASGFLAFISHPKYYCFSTMRLNFIEKKRQALINLKWVFDPLFDPSLFSVTCIHTVSPRLQRLHPCHILAPAQPMELNMLDGVTEASQNCPRRGSPCGSKRLYFTMK